MIQDFIDKHFYILFLFTLTFGILLYDTIGFDYTDEFCALFLFILFAYHVLKTENWQINKAFLITMGVFLFYLCYSLYRGSNVKAGILTDFLIQIKPYLAFFCVYSMMPKFNLNRKEILKSVVLIYWFILMLIGVGDIFIPRLIFTLMWHPAYYAAAVVAVSLSYLFCTKFTWKDRLIFLGLLSIGIFSGRSKFYGFYAYSIFVVFFFSNIKYLKLSFRNVVIMVLMAAAVFFVAREKIYFYFFEAATEDAEKELVARFMLYATTPEILKDYFPLGSGFATFGTYASGVYYSSIYEEYGIDAIWGITKSNYSFIADTFFPSLAQFGVLGILFFLSFWIYIIQRAIYYYKKTLNIQYITMVILIVGYFLIECTTDSTFTTHRGFFIMMVLGLVLGSMKNEMNMLQEDISHNEDTTDQ